MTEQLDVRAVLQAFRDRGVTFNLLSAGSITFTTPEGVNHTALRDFVLQHRQAIADALKAEAAEQLAERKAMQEIDPELLKNLRTKINVLGWISEDAPGHNAGFRGRQP